MSAGARILASGSPGEIRVALIEDGVLTELWIERPGLVVSRVGDLQRGRITARAPAMGGAFVALAGGETGFLPDTEADATNAKARAQALAEGRILALRVTRAGQGGKGPRVTARVTDAECGLVGAGPAHSRAFSALMTVKRADFYDRCRRRLARCGLPRTLPVRCVGSGG